MHRRMLSALLILLLASAAISAKLITPYGENKNATSIDLNIQYIGNNTYNASIVLNRILIDVSVDKEKETESTAGRFVIPATAIEPVAEKRIKINIGEESRECTTNDNGECSWTINIDQIEVEESGCTSINAVFDGDKINKGAKSATRTLCRNQFISFAPAIAEVVKKISEDALKSNVCIMFFILIGFLISGLYASGKDPLRLLDITSPRLPSARKKPEIRITVSENSLRAARREIKRNRDEIEGMIEKSIPLISKKAGERIEDEIAGKIARANKISVENAKKIFRANIRRERRREERRMREEMNANIDRIRREFKRKQRELSELKKRDAIIKEKDLVKDMYAEMANALDQIASEYDIKFPKKAIIENSVRLAEMEHMTNLHSLTERGRYGGKGTVGKARKFVEGVPLVGYAVRTADNMYGLIKMPVSYVKGKIKTASEIRRIKRKIKKREESLKEREMPEEIRREISELQAKLIELQQKSALLPDRVKDHSESTIYSTQLLNEIINAACHMMLKDIRERMDNKEFDRWYGKAVRERDLLERFRRIKDYGQQKRLLDESTMNEATRLVNSVRKYSKSPFDNFDEIVAKAREIGNNPERYGLLVVDEIDEIRRYIELHEYVAPDVLEVCGREGLSAGIEYLRKKENMQTWKDIRRTHAEFVKGTERYRARITDIKNEMQYFLLYSREFLGLISFLRSKGMLPATISREKFDRLRRYYAREMNYIENKTNELKSRAKIMEEVMAINDEMDERKEKVRSTVINSLKEMTPLMEEGSAMAFLDSYEKRKEEELIDVQKKLDKEETLLEEAIEEWAREKMLDRAVGITIKASLEKDITRLSNKAEGEGLAYRQAIRNAEEYNESKRPAIENINRLLGIVENTENKTAEDIVLEMDKEVRKVLFRSLMQFYRMVENERMERGLDLEKGKDEMKKIQAGEYWYREAVIGGKTHIFVKGFRDPSEMDTINLMKLFEKVFSDRSSQLAEIAAKTGNVDLKRAENYVNFYKLLERHAILHPGLDLPYDAASKFPWIFEAKNVYKAVPEQMLPYEIMGPADTLVNYELVYEKGRKVVKVPKGRIEKVRNLLNWFNIQSNMYIGGAYIGLLAETAATTVMYTRHAERIKGGAQYYRGKGTSVEDVLRNEKLAAKLVDAYRLRIVQGKLNKFGPEEQGYIAKALDAGKIKKQLAREIESIARRTSDETERRGLSEALKKIKEYDFSNTDELDEAIKLCRDYVGEYEMREKLGSLITMRDLNIAENREKESMARSEVGDIYGRIERLAKRMRRAVDELRLSEQEIAVFKTIISKMEKAAGTEKNIGGAWKRGIDEIIGRTETIRNEVVGDEKKKCDAFLHILEDDIKIKIDRMAERHEQLKEDEIRYRTEAKMHEIIGKSSIVGKELARNEMAFMRRIFVGLKGKFMDEAEIGIAPLHNPKRKLIDEINYYDRKVRERGKRRTKMERVIDNRLRTISEITDSFLDHAYSMMKSTLNAGMHTRAKNYGLDIASSAGFQFAGPIASSLIQRLATFGKYGNRGWFTSLYLSYPIAKAQNIYKKRYPLLHRLGGTPAVYEPMKRMNTGAFGYIELFMLRKIKNKIARIGEVLRTTSSSMPPPAYFHYLRTANMFGEARFTEMFELLRDGFKATPRGPRDMLNYLLYRPNDLVMDFKDMLYTMKEGRSMKKTPEHLRDVGIYGVAANSKFIAGREIQYVESALGSGASMYPQRAFNAFYSQPHLSMPTLAYPAYGEVYEKTEKPSEVATEMLHMDRLSKSVVLRPLVIIPSLIVAPTFLPILLFNIPFTFYYGRNVYRNMPNILPKFLDWKTHKIIMDRYRHMYTGIYQPYGGA